MSQMEFWGISFAVWMPKKLLGSGAEVKSGESLEVDPVHGVVLHLSQACMGEVKKDKVIERICLFVKVDEQNLALGTLSSEKFPQISFDLVFEKKFELSHNWKNGSVYFTGYRAYALEEDESSEENFPVVPRHVGKSQVKQAAKPHGTAAKQVRIVEPNKVEDTDEDVDQDTSSDEDLSEASNKDAAKMNSEEESSEGDDSSDDEEGGEDEDEETSKMAEERKKRPIQSAQKTPADKKAKLITPQRIEGKKFGGRVATPYPSKQAATKERTPKSGGAYPCKSCNRSFSSETGLQAHSKAKHSAGK